MNKNDDLEVYHVIDRHFGKEKECPACFGNKARLSQYNSNSTGKYRKIRVRDKMMSPISMGSFRNFGRDLSSFNLKDSGSYRYFGEPLNMKKRSFLILYGYFNQ